MTAAGPVVRPRRQRIGWPSVDLDVQRIVSMGGRAAEALTRRDVARALLAMPGGDAMAALPGLRRQLLAAGNPWSAAFGASAAAALQKGRDGPATAGARNSGAR